MSGRSPSGVASLRARFEQKKESTSPPSRGRSPAGSVTSDGSRPLSKVRTSFVSVDGSGKMGDQLDMKEQAGGDVTAGDVSEGSKAVMNGDIVEKVDTNGDTLLHPASAETSKPGVDTKKELGQAGSIGGGSDGPSDVNPDKPIASAENDPVSMLPADPKDEGATSGGAALGEETAELGSILKGSPFEQEAAENASASKPSKSKAPAAQSQPPKQQSKPHTPGLVNGKPKEASKLAPQSKSKAAPGPAPSHPKPPPPPVFVSTTDVSVSKPEAASPPAAVKTQPDPPAPSSTAAETSGSKPLETSSPEPRTPTSTTATTKQGASPSKLSSSKPSPKPGSSKEPKKDAVNDVKKPIGRPSAVSKPATAAPAKPSQAPSTSANKPVKKSVPTSPKSAFTKPRPKSPTRMARLPAAATAPTAASAAKLDGPVPSKNDKKPTNPLPVRDRVISNPTKPHHKPARTSLPAGPKVLEKLKAPKARMSMASTKAPEGSFLERMMRPTQSSAQKTHDKVEVKTPPKKHHGLKPKRLSEGSDKSKSDHAEVKGEEPKGSGATAESARPVEPAVQDSAGPSEAPSTNGAPNPTNMAAESATESIPTS